MAKRASTKQQIKPKRVRTLARHSSFKLTRKKLSQHRVLPNPIALIRSTLALFKSHWKVYLGISTIYALLTVVFVQGIGSGLDMAELKANVESLIGVEQGSTAQVTTAVTLFGYLLTNASSSATEVSGTYQLILALIVSLATIWATRQILASEIPQVRDTFYKGMYPLIPFLIVLIVIGLQLIPLIIGNLIFSTVLQNGLAATFIEKAIWFVLFVMLALLSLYMIISSVFSLYIATLPDMTPIRALRSARELVIHRRVQIILRIVVPLLLLGLITLLIYIPLLIVLPQITQYLFVITASISFVLMQVYMYMLYRELL